MTGPTAQGTDASRRGLVKAVREYLS